MVGLKIIQKRAPLGVIAMIFESQSQCICWMLSAWPLRQDMLIILRGGRDAICSNTALISIDSSDTR